MNTDLIRQFAEATLVKGAAKERLEECNEELRRLDRLVQDELIGNGVASLPVETSDGRMTVYVRTILNVKPGDGHDRDDVAAAMKRCGLRDLVAEGYNANSLSAAVRERLADGKNVWPSLDKVIRIDERTEARATKATRAKSKSAAAAEQLAKGASH